MPLLDRRMPQPHPPAMKPLVLVAQAARKRLEAEEKYEAALIRAREAGLTFEEIAFAAGTTRSAIHNYLSRRGQT